MDSEHAIERIPVFNATKSNSGLNASATFWFLVALLGQWLFVYYIILAYGGSAMQGNFEKWGTLSLKGHVSGDFAGNVAFASHVFMAAIITLGGTIQLVPQIRAKAAVLHRWNGRLFITTALLMSFGGLYLIWVRESTTSIFGAIGITVNATLIILFGLMAIIKARSRDFKAHRQWALRTFIMVSGVWFFRVGLMAWYIITEGAGSTENLDGPFDVFWAFGNYLLPLFILELYFLSQKSVRPRIKWGMTILLIASTIVMAIGIFGAFMFMWKPSL